MQWQPLSNIEILKRLEIPAADSGKVLDMVLDTDTYNEVDDQFALCYALCSPERLNVQAVYAAPFFNDRSNGPEQGMERSYDEIVRLLGKMGHPTENFVFKGSRDYLKDMDTPQDSPAARDLVARGMARPDDDPLYVVAIGAITNVASALIMEPRLARKIIVVWLGGNSLTYPHTREFAGRARGAHGAGQRRAVHTRAVHGRCVAPADQRARTSGVHRRQERTVRYADRHTDGL